MVCLTFERVHKNYGDNSQALKGVSFEVSDGEFVALAGPSGSGKTTALNLAAGLDIASSGRVLLLGENLGSLQREKMTALRRNNVGFVFQSYNLLPVLTALENVEYPLALRSVPASLRRDISMALLEEVGLADLKDRLPRDLSGGQQQRVAVARAMVTNPKIVFADEPTANLDSKSAENLLWLFRRLNERRNTTFLFSSHDPRVLKAAKRTIFLADGAVTKEETHQTSRTITSFYSSDSNFHRWTEHLTNRRHTS